MKDLCTYASFLPLLVTLLMIDATTAVAHGTAYRVLDKAAAVTTEFYYDDREPMQYAEVLIFSPFDEKIEYQNGRTDRLGRFAFYPESTGIWRIEVKDGMGHMVRGEIEVAADSTESPELVHSHQDNEPMAMGQLSRAGKTAFGLSLMFNLVAIAYLLKQRRAVKKRRER